MPELPEAETIVRGIRPAVEGRTVDRVHVLRPDVLRTSPRTFRARVKGRTIQRARRRGKKVVLDLGGGDVLAINLGMTGRVLPFPGPPRGRHRPTHPAVRLYFDDGGLLVFDDQRRFGSMEFLDAEGWARLTARLGPEPLSPDFHPGDLFELLSRSRSPVRSWLLDQKRIAGVGNIYAAEALFLAGVHPKRPARSVSEDEARRLHGSLQHTLQGAIDGGGTTIRDYRNADGEEGRYARRLQVYGREGEPCVVCGGEVKRIVFGNRSAFLCPRCQPERGATP